MFLFEEEQNNIIILKFDKEIKINSWSDKFNYINFQRLAGRQAAVHLFNFETR